MPACFFVGWLVRFARACVCCVARLFFVGFLVLRVFAVPPFGMRVLLFVGVFVVALFFSCVCWRIVVFCLSTLYSTSPPGGNQVDGLPPALHSTGAVVMGRPGSPAKMCDKGHFYIESY